MKKLILVVAAIALFTLAGCSGKGNGASCSSVTPCGGTAVGTWNLVSGCFNSSSTTSISCGVLTEDTSETFADGTLTVGADLSYSLTVNMSRTTSDTFPTACLATYGATSCASLGQVDQAANPGTTVSCTTTSGGCSCTSSSPAAAQTDNGTYSNSGNYVTTTSASTGTMTQYAYCVSGTQLTMSPQYAGTATETETGSFVFTKQ
jgi:hypothetical protein